MSEIYSVPETSNQWRRPPPKGESSIQELNQLNNLIYPDQLYNFQTLQNEIKRLKIQDLTIQIPLKKQELEQLTNDIKEKCIKVEKYLFEKLLKKHTKLLHSNNNPNFEKLSKLKEVLNEKFTPEELQIFLDKQVEIFNLEKHLESLQQNQEQSNHQNRKCIKSPPKQKEKSQDNIRD